MYAKQKNKTAVQSQHAIADALFGMMKRKPFAQITVTEICEAAGVGRKTFYRNFELREDVVEFRLDEMCADYLEELAGLRPDQYLRHHFEYVRKHSERFILLYQNGLASMVNKKYSTLLPETMPVWSEDPIEQEYRSAYIIAGMDAIQRTWITRGCAETIDRVVELAQKAQGEQIPIR